MTYPVITPVVEGHGEIESVRSLLEPLVQWLHSDTYVHVNPPVRKQSTQL